jgi:hypothetical protein
MSLYLSRLAIQEEDIGLERVSTLAEPESLIREMDKVAKKEEERDRILHMVHECKYHDTVILPNFDARLGKYAPPTGYAAVMHEDTTFRCDMVDRHLFRGVAVTNLVRSKRFSDQEMKDACIRMNQFIRDQSPKPPTLQEGVYGNWVPSLGTFGWIGVYEKRGVNTSVHERTYCIAVVASVDDVTYEAMRDECIRMHGKVSVKEAIETLQPYREMTIINRGRLLALTVEILGEQSKEMMAAPDLVYERPSGDGLVPIPRSLWEWLPPPPIRIPLWYVVPRKTPKDVPPIPTGCTQLLVGMNMTEQDVKERGERYPTRILPEVDAFVDDFKLYLPFTLPDTSHAAAAAKTMDEKRAVERREMEKKGYDTKQVIRYAGCSDVSKAAVWLRGPLHPMAIAQKRAGADITAFSGNFYAYPAQVAQGECTGNVEEVTIVHTWEDAELTVNRLAQAEFPKLVEGASSTIVGGTTWDQVIYDPLFVRISCKDAHEWVKEEKTKKRMTGFCAPVWIGL